MIEDLNIFIQTKKVYYLQIRHCKPFIRRNVSSKVEQLQSGSSENWTMQKVMVNIVSTAKPQTHFGGDLQPTLNK